MRDARAIFHYPWRLTLPPAKRQDLPMPTEGMVSPEIGAFYQPTENAVPEELPCPSVAPGRAQDECRARDGSVFRYDRECVHQYNHETPDSTLRRGHFALSDAAISLSTLLYREREARALFFYELPLASRDDAETGEHEVGACERFEAYLKGGKDFASASLIHEIAEHVIAAIENIVTAPRKVLARVHREVPIARVQEFDNTALLDYARRPGRNAPMKAGAKQRLLGVVREESTDTPENRVVLDFIWRTESAALQYVMEMQERCPLRGSCRKKECDGCQSGRLRTVLHFIRKCESWKRTENLRGVHRLERPFTRANYVLQQNARYVQVWRFYLKLLAQENVETEVWRWRRRAFADLMRMTMMCLWELRLRWNGHVVLQTSERPFMIRETNDRGEWLADDPFEDALVFRGDAESSAEEQEVTLYLLNPKEAAELLDCVYLRRLNADFLWVTLSDGMRPRVCPVWVMCEDRKWKAQNVGGIYEERVLSEVVEVCEMFARTARLDVSRGWVIVPGDGDERVIRRMHGEFIFLRVDVFRHFENVMDALQPLVEGMLEL